MKIYFNATPLGKKEGLEKNYKRIYQEIEELGHTHVSKFILRADAEVLSKQTHEEAVKFYKQMLQEMKSADIVILEVSRHSTGVGHQASLALSFGKPLIALHLEGRSPYLFTGIQDDRLILVSYDLESVRKVLEDSIDYAQGMLDVRFNFFVSPQIQHYLDWVAKFKRTPRAVYLRELLEKDMQENKEWKKQK